MIDIHTHILPMIDDGAVSVKMALDLLDEAYRDGTDEIILTPHFAYPYGFNNPKDKIIDLFYDLKRIVKQAGIPIKMYLGCEYLFVDVDSFYQDLYDIQTLNDSQYILIEFYFDIEENIILQAVETLIKENYIPIIAHPERFEVIQDNEEFIKIIVEKGALLQMNKGSILGRYGSRVKRTCEYILCHEYYSFVGSDAHNTHRRTSHMYDAYDYIREVYGNTYAKKIFKDNPRKLLENKDIRREDHYEED